MSARRLLCFIGRHQWAWGFAGKHIWCVWCGETAKP